MKTLSFLFALTLSQCAALAGTHTWSGAASGLWDNPANWSSGGRPSNAEPNLHIVFPVSATRFNSTNNLGGLVIQTITFNGSGYNVHGLGFGTNITMGASGNFTSSGLANVLGGTLHITIAGNHSIQVSDGSALTIASQLQGSATVYKMGPGTATFSCDTANTYSGTTVVSDGTLRLQGGFPFLGGVWISAVSIPSGLYIGGTNMSLNPRALFLASSQLASNIPVTIHANGALDLNGFDDHVGPLTMTGGTIETGGGGTLTLLDDVIANHSPHINGSIAGNLSLGTSTRDFNVTGGSFGISASISGLNGGRGAPGVTKLGLGELVLVGSNSYSGLTTVSAGVLEVASTRALGTTNAGTIVASNAQLNLSFSVAGEALTLSGRGTNGAFGALYPLNSAVWTGPITLLGETELLVGDNRTLVLTGPISGNGSLRHSGRGTIELGGSAHNTFTGYTRVVAGRLRLAKPAYVTAVPGPLNVGFLFEDAVIEWLADEQLGDNASVELEPGATLDLQDHFETIGSLTLDQGLVQATTGTLQLNGNVEAIGQGVSLIDGKLSLGGTTRLFHTEPGASLYIEANIVNGVAAAGLTVGGGGNFALRGSNAFSGPVLVTDGWLYLQHPLGLGATSAGTTVQGGGRLDVSHVSVTNETLTLAAGAGEPWWMSIGTNSWNGPVIVNEDSRILFFGSNHRLNIGGPISGAGDLTIRDGGTVEFSGPSDNTLSGVVQVADGTLLLNKSSGATAISGPLVVGDPFVGSFSFARLLANNQIANNVVVKTHYFGWFDIETFSESIGGLEMHGGRVDGSTGVLTLLGNVSVSDGSASISARTSLGGATRTFTVNSSLSGPNALSDGGAPAGLIKNGPGPMTLVNSNSYSGPTVVTSGVMEIWNRHALGAATAGTTISDGATLALFSVSNLLEELTITGNGAAGTSGVLRAEFGNCHIAAPMHLAGDALIHFASNNITLNLACPIDGSGDFVKDGLGTLTFSGASANTFSGATTVRRGDLLLHKTAGVDAVPESLTIGNTNDPANSAQVKLLAFNQIHGTGAGNHTVTVNRSGKLDLGLYDDAIAHLALTSGRVDGSGTLKINGDITANHISNVQSVVYSKVSLTAGTHDVLATPGSYLTFYESISEAGSAALRVGGGGTVQLGGSNSFSGAIEVNGSILTPAHPWALGTTNGGVLVTNQGTLFLSGVSISNEPLTLFGNGSYSFGEVFVADTNTWTGAIQLNGLTTIYQADNSTRLTLAGPIAGSGSVDVSGFGSLRLTGTNNNSFTGGFTTRLPLVELVKTNATALVGPVSVGVFGGATTNIIRYLRGNQIADTASLHVDGTGLVELNNFTEIIGALSGRGEVAMGTGTFLANSDGSSSTFSGTISGGANCVFNKAGAGTLTLTGTNTMPGFMLVSRGKLCINGLQPIPTVSVQTNATLCGTGVVGNVFALAGGTISPGASAGTLKAFGNVVMSPGSKLLVELFGTNAGTQYDQLRVGGNFVMNGATLETAMNFQGAISNTFTVVAHFDAGTNSGNFSGLGEGAVLNANGSTLRLSYAGGSGHDVVLTQTAVFQPSFTTITLQQSGYILLAGAGALGGGDYTVEANADLSNTNGWTTIGIATANATGWMNFTDTNAPLFWQRFYRCRTR